MTAVRPQPSTATAAPDPAGVSAELLASIRRRIGTGGGSGPRAARVAVGEGMGWYPLLVLMAFAALTELFVYVPYLLGPEIAGALGLSASGVSMIFAQQTAAGAINAVVVAATLRKRDRRAAAAIQAVLTLTVAGILAAYATNRWMLFGFAGGVGTAVGAVYATHRPMLADGFPSDVRVRAVSWHRAAALVGAALAGLAVYVIDVRLGGSWRLVLLVLAVLAALAALGGARLRAPRPGRFDTDLIRDLARSGENGEADASAAGEVDDAGDAADADEGLSFVDSLRQIWPLPCVRSILVGWAVIGAITTPLVGYCFFFLRDRYHLDVGGRSVVFVVVCLLAVPLLALFARRAERVYRADPRRLLSAGAGLLVTLAAALVLAVAVPVLALSVLFLAVIFAAVAALVPALTIPMFDIVGSRLRPQVSALSALASGIVGGEAGSLALGGVESRFGPAVAIGVLAAPALLAARMIARARSSLDGELDGAVRSVVEDENVAIVRRTGGTLPLLSCRGIDFEYGNVQVLFDVDFSVAEGDMIALLGTNGAGKSTLLRVISGTGLPRRGSVHFGGKSITFLNAAARTRLGISQVPGGRAVFGPLTVLENLRLYGTGLGRDHARIESGIEESFAAFPNLFERRDIAAANLSGGEQQMLALSKALILRPQLLLIDELSLGLAPKIVGELLDVVRRLNADGTSVVLVEQSVNVALEAAREAYFMEKGEVRFHGRTSELLERPDLLRSVFMAGASATFATEDGVR